MCVCVYVHTNLYFLKFNTLNLTEESTWSGNYYADYDVTAVAVPKEGVSFFDCLGQPLAKQVSRITWDVHAAEKGGYDHFMLKEIMEQPGAVKAAISPRLKNNAVVFEELKLTKEDLAGIRKIVITACGSACPRKLNGLDCRVFVTLSRRFLAVVSPNAFSSTFLA